MSQSSFELSPLVLSPTTEVARLYDAKTMGGKRSSATAHTFRVTGATIDIDVQYIYWWNGEREVRISTARTAPLAITRAVGHRRLAVMDVDQAVGYNALMQYACLQQARTKDDQGWSSLYWPTMAELDEGAGLPVASTLQSLGAGEVGTHLEVFGGVGRTSSLIVVTFPCDNEVVPVAAFVLTRVLPLLNGVTTRTMEP